MTDAAEILPEEPWYKRFEVLLTLGLSISISLLTATFLLGQYFGEKDLEVYKSLSKLDLPAATAETRAATAQLIETSAAFKEMLVKTSSYQDMKVELDSAKTEVAEYQRRSEATQKELSNQIRDLALLNQTIIELTPKGETHVISEGGSIPFVGNVSVGLTDWFASSVYLNVAGKNNRQIVADVIDYESSLVKCTITLQKISKDKTATVLVDCSPIGDFASPMLGANR
ncbi:MULTISPECIES: hypothetical protein [Rhizobium/Agrobacterium group]|uniref:hypothetical protein n=1 Tax=Rhizobium/Agrobacterium group TaxID=227290 RepID=UPI00230192C7|nr:MULTISPECIES: hypothetical protein [Rhizobium/Agrobacterium group]MDA5632578.1 hypothetical protein [Agrobacterium sp. ST15.16.024]MDF1888443.1 hypothetical protein [Rhizobium rhizogenes]